MKEKIENVVVHVGGVVCAGMLSVKAIRFIMKHRSAQ